MKAAESSTVVAFRALVMLACLVIAPLAAIFGSTFPDVVRKWLIDPLMSHADSAAPGVDSAGRQIDDSRSPTVNYSHENSGAVQPPQGPASFWQPVAPASTANGLTTLTASPDAISSSGPISSYPAAATPGNIGASAPTNYPSPSNYASTPGLVSPAGAISQGDQPGATQAAFSVPIDAPAAGTGLGQSPAAATDPFGRSQMPPSIGPSATTSASGSVYGSPPGVAPANRPAGESEQFAWYEKKLREYGAAYYLLETWGNEGELYRFHCKMAVAGNQTYTRHFEATDRDKLQAMAKVLEQVEAWRGGRLP